MSEESIMLNGARWLTEIQPIRLYPVSIMGWGKHRRRALRWTCRAIAASLCLSAVAPAQAASVSVGVQANALKPLVLSKVQDLNLGTITLGPGLWSGATVSLSRAGAFTCASTNLTCSGVTQVAQYNVQGSNQQTVLISAPDVNMTNQSDSSQTLTLTVDRPASIVLPNSGQPGVDFSIGGSVTVSSSTVAGTYVGTFNVTADYQ
jgi:Domain of unknown function (DUF4402)